VPPKKVLALAYSKKQAALLKAEAEKTCADCEVVYVALDFDVSRETRFWLEAMGFCVDYDDASDAVTEKGMTIKALGDYLDRVSFDGLDELVSSMSRNWFKHASVEGICTYEGLSLGKLAEYDMYYFVRDVVKNIATVKAVVEREKPDKIIVACGRNPLTLAPEVVAEAAGIKAARVPVSDKKTTEAGGTYKPVRKLRSLVRKALNGFGFRGRG